MRRDARLAAMTVEELAVASAPEPPMLGLPAPPTAPWARLREAIAVGGGALLAFVLLGQSTVYGDGYSFLPWLKEGFRDHHNHPGFMPVLALFRDVGAWGGLSIYRSALLCSQLGAAVGLACLHDASALVGLDRRRRWLTTLLVGACPTLVFFATVVEVHAPFFACIGLATLAAAALVRRVTYARAALLGLATGLSYPMHASGMILPVPLVLVFVALRRDRGDPWPRLLRVTGVALAAHVAVLLAIWVLLKDLGRSGTPLSAVEFVAHFAAAAIEHPQRLAMVVVNEWLWPYLPLSLLWLTAWRSAQRRLALAIAGSLLVFLPLTWLVLGDHWVEHGAYLLPLAWPVALVVVLRLPGRAVLATLGTLLAIALGTVAWHDHPEQPRAFADGLHEIAGGRPVHLLIGVPDFEPCFVSVPDVPFLLLPSTPFIEPSIAPKALTQLDRFVDQQWQKGVLVILTRAAENELDDPGYRRDKGGLRLTAEHLRRHYHLEPVKAAGFEGKLLRPRSR